jgi:hypothetical protein
MRSQLQKAPMDLKRSLWSAFAPAQDIPAVLTNRSIRVMPMVAPANHRPGSFGSLNTAEEIANLIDIKDEQIAAVFVGKTAAAPQQVSADKSCQITRASAKNPVIS